MPDAGIGELIALFSASVAGEAAAGAGVAELAGAGLIGADALGAGALGAGVGAGAVGAGEAALGAGLAEGIGGGLGTAAAFDAAGSVGALGAESLATSAGALGAGGGVGGGIADAVGGLGAAGAAGTGATDAAGFASALGGLGADAGAATPAAVDVGAAGTGAAGAGGAQIAPGVVESGGIGASPTSLAPVSPLPSGPGFGPVPEGVPLGGGDLTALQGQQALVADGSNALGVDVGGAPVTAGEPSAAGGDGFIHGAGADAPNLSSSGFPGAGSAVGGESQSTLSQLGDFFKPATDFLSGPGGKILGAGVSGAGLLKNLSSAGAPNPIRGQAELAALAKSLGASSNALSATGAGLTASNAAGATGVAERATGQAATLQNYLTTGTLPPAVQASLDRATEDAVTKVKSDFASRRVGPGSTQENAAIASIRQNATIQGGTLAAQLYSQGVSLDQLAADIYKQLTGAGVQLSGAGTQAAAAGAGALESGVATNLGINNGLNSAIANLGAALGGRNVSNTGTQVAA